MASTTDGRGGSARSDRPGWRAVAVTGAQADVAEAVAALRLRQERGVGTHESGLTSGTTFVAAPDFAPSTTAPLGSGAATLNALLVLAEHLSAQEGYSFVESQVVQRGLIAIVHLGGRDRPRVPPADPVPKALALLPLAPVAGRQEQSEPQQEGDEVVAAIDLLLAGLVRLPLLMVIVAAGCLESGVVVGSTEALLVVPDEGEGQLGGVSPDCATLLAVEAPAHLAPQHGVCLLRPLPAASARYHEVETILYQQSLTTLRERGALVGDALATAYVYTGVVVLGSSLAGEILRLNAVPPLDSCTYLAVDNGATPVAFDLYSDLLLVLAAGSEKQAYLNQPIRVASPSSRVRHLREAAWQYLRANQAARLRACVAAPGAQYLYLRTTAHLFELLQRPPPALRVAHHARSFLAPTVERAEGSSVVLNSIGKGEGSIGAGSLLAHSVLTGHWRIGDGSLVSGIRGGALHVGPGVYVHELELELDRHERAVVVAARADKDGAPGAGRLRCTVAMGVTDDVDSDSWFGRPIAQFLEAAGWDARDVWESDQEEGGAEGAGHCRLWECRLFPLYSGDGDGEADAHAVRRAAVEAYSDPACPAHRPSLDRLRALPRVSLAHLLATALPHPELLWRDNLGFSVAREKMQQVLLARSDECLLPLFEPFVRAKRPDLLLSALDSAGIQAARAGDALVVMRSLAAIADALAAFAGPRAGLRSGPARNSRWQAAFDLLAGQRFEEAIRELAQQRAAWMAWETPELLMRAVRHYERAAQVMVSLSVLTAQRHVAAAPPPPPSARAPLGSWVVVDLPARMDFAGGWTDTPPITFERGGCVVNIALLIDGKKPITARARRIEAWEVVIDVGEEHTVCTQLGDLSDHAQPLAPGALVKTVLLYMGLVSLSSAQDLREQLQQALGSGLHVVCATSLPQGSGLGTSSIMAGALLKAIGAAIGRDFDPRSLAHAVLVELLAVWRGSGDDDDDGHDVALTRMLGGDGGTDVDHGRRMAGPSGRTAPRHQVLRVPRVAASLHRVRGPRRPGELHRHPQPAHDLHLHRPHASRARPPPGCPEAVARQEARDCAADGGSGGQRTPPARRSPSWESSSSGRLLGHLLDAKEGHGRWCRACRGDGDDRMRPGLHLRLCSGRRGWWRLSYADHQDAQRPGSYPGQAVVSSTLPLPRVSRRHSGHDSARRAYRREPASYPKHQLNPVRKLCAHKYVFFLSLSPKRAKVSQQHDPTGG